MSRVNVGFGLLTLFPGRVGGSETYVRGLLGAFGAGHGPEQVTVLANRPVLRSFAGYARGPVLLRSVRSYRSGDALATRALALASARVAPQRVAAAVPPGLDLLHYAVTVPVPQVSSVPTVNTVHDLSHL